jgi:MFS superfamily sulfate permease-like transporter
MAETPPGATETLRQDGPASIVVFLVALPLCLGVALASGAPLIAGLIAGVIGGLLVAPISGSSLMVSGPAAGLTTIVFAAIERLGGFEPFLVALVLAGILQLGFGLLRFGFIAAFFPTAVIKGMLAAIGLILILKQIPHAVGYDADPEGDFAFRQPDSETTLSAFGELAGRVELGAVIIAVVGLVVLFLWDRPALRKLRLMPGPLVVVIAGIALNELFGRLAPGLQLADGHLVQLPGDGTPRGLFAELQFPAWQVLTQPAVYVTAVTLALVASLETLLSLEATDKLDPLKRRSPASRELVAQGIGNLTAGLVGGIPLTGVIVRSAANIEAGARTRLSAVLHSIQLAAATLLVPGLLNRIPLAALAAVLLHVGWKLAHPLQLVRAWRVGRDQFIPFFVTIAAIMFTDLLVGVLIGLLTGTFFILREHAEAPGLTPIGPPGAVLRRYSLGPQATFLSRVRIANTLDALPAHARIEIDARDCRRIDPDVLQLLHDFAATARERDIDYRLVGVPPLPTQGGGGAH